MSRFIRVAVIVLSIAAAAQAGFEKWYSAGRLTSGPWNLCERDGRVFLIRKSADLTDYGMTPLEKWSLNAPVVVESKSRRRLVVDTSGAEPQLALVEGRATGADWTFEIVENLTPRQNSSSSPPRQKGELGIRTYLVVGEGRWRGWYVAAEVTPDDVDKTKPQAQTKSLRLVQDKKSAMIFTHIRRVYY